MKRRYLILITLVAAMVFPLLVGPYAWLDFNGHLPEEIRAAVDPAYQFVEIEAARFDVTQRMFNSYVALWLGGEFEAAMYQIDKVDLSHLP